MTSAEPSLNRAEEAEHKEKDVVSTGGRKRARDETTIDEIEIEIETVTDGEVEEFCAILRRLRRPIKYFGGIERVKRWRPSFMAEDFNGVEEVVAEKVEKENGGGGSVVGVGIQKRLDLNVDPLTE